MLLKWRQRHFVRFLPLIGNPFLVPVGLQQLLKQLSVRSPKQRFSVLTMLWWTRLPEIFLASDSHYHHSLCRGKKAVEDCMLVCNVIAPNDSKTLFHALASPGGEKDETAEADDLLKSLMTTYKNSKTKSIKTQILRRISTRSAHEKNFTRHMESCLHYRYRERGVMQER